jgi:hypothetical protein
MKTSEEKFRSMFDERLRQMAEEKERYLRTYVKVWARRGFPFLTLLLEEGRDYSGHSLIESFRLVTRSGATHCLPSPHSRLQIDQKVRVTSPDTCHFGATGFVDQVYGRNALDDPPYYVYLTDAGQGASSAIPCLTLFNRSELRPCS